MMKTRLAANIGVYPFLSIPNMDSIELKTKKLL